MELFAFKQKFIIFQAAVMMEARLTRQKLNAQASSWVNQSQKHLSTTGRRLHSSATVLST